MQKILSVSVLVSDRVDTVDRCLNSLIPILKNIPSELIVVYTGKSDESLAIAKKYTDHIIPFTWCDDFSKARNIGLEAATGEWFMFLDDDEWFENTTEIVDFFQNKEYQAYQTACYTVRNYFDLEGTRWSDISAPRMIRRTEDVKFVGLVHEGFSPWREPNKTLNCYAHHYGYAEKNGQRDSEKYERNISLLKKQIAMNPNHIRSYIYLAQQHYNAGEYEIGEQYCRKVLELDQESWATYDTQWATVMLTASFAARNQMEQAYKEATVLLSLHPFAELYRLYLAIYLLPACYGMGYYEEGTSIVLEFRRIWQQMESSPEKWDEQRLLDINRSNLLKRSYYVYSHGVLCACYLGDFSLATELLKEIQWDSEYKKEEKQEFFEKLLAVFSDKAETFSSVFAELKSEDSFILLQQALYYEQIGNELKARYSYNRCQVKAERNFAYPLILMAFRNGYELPSAFEYLDLDDWRFCAQSISDTIDIVDFRNILRQIEIYFASYPMQKQILEQKILAKVIFDEAVSRENLIDVLLQYCSVVLELNKQLYRPELFEVSMQYCLPKECRVALELQEILDLLKKQTTNNCIEKVKLLIHKNPELSPVARILTDYISENFLDAAQTKRNQEFAETGEKIKKIMKQLADHEQYEEALQVAEKLETLLPGDSEIIKYKKLLREML